MPLVFGDVFRNLPCMVLRLLLAGAFAATASAQTTQSQLELANLSQDVRGLTQRVGELTLRLEQVERENAELSRKAGAAERSFVTLSQLNDAIASLNATLKSAVTEAKSETLQQAGVMVEKLGKQTNAALDSLAQSMATRPAVQTTPTTFSEDFPKEGVKYTVQKGDNLALIAKKTGAKQQDIINANKLPDPSRIAVGQTLFIPGGK